VKVFHVVIVKLSKINESILTVFDSS